MNHNEFLEFKHQSLFSFNRSYSIFENQVKRLYFLKDAKIVEEKLIILIFSFSMLTIAFVFGEIISFFNPKHEHLPFLDFSFLFFRIFFMYCVVSLFIYSCQFDKDYFNQLFKRAIKLSTPITKEKNALCLSILLFDNNNDKWLSNKQNFSSLTYDQEMEIKTLLKVKIENVKNFISENK